MSALVAVLVALVVLAGRGPGGRRPTSWRIHTSDPQATGAPPADAPRGGERHRRVDLAVVVIQVASELRSGADPGRAWERAIGRPIGGGGPDRRLLEELAGPRQLAEAAAVDAAGRLATSLGASLAQVLERIASGLAAAAEADGERRAALAGPRATARVLTALPVLGVGLGAAVGADPVGVLLGGGIGTAALVVGCALLLLGRWWIGRLVRAATRAGQRP